MVRVRIPTHRPPTHPGEILLEEFLKPMGISQRELADAIRVPEQHISGIINQRRRVTHDMAFRLSKFLGTPANFWTNLQLRWDVRHKRLAEACAKVDPAEEQALAEEGLSEDLARWPEY